MKKSINLRKFIDFFILFLYYNNTEQEKLICKY